MSRNRKSLNRRFQIETLESRDLKAGNVSVSVDNGVLNVAGDSQGNQIEIHQSSVNWYRVTGLNGTTVNGKEDKLVRVTGGMNVNLNAGNDELNIGGTIFVDDIDGNLNINMGAGQDKVVLGKVDVDGSTVINTDTEDDTVNLAFGTYHALTVDTGSQNDIVNAAGVVASSLNINTQAGLDTVDLLLVKSLGVIDVKSGADADTVRVNNVKGATTVSIDTSLGADTVEVKNQVIANALNVKTGAGADVVQLPNLITNGSVTVETEADSDQVTVTGSQIDKLLSIKTAAGDDVVALSNVLAKGGISILTDTGADTLLLTDVTAPGKNITIDTGDNADLVTLNRVAADKLFASLGTGGDRIDILNSIFNLTNIDGGDGGDDFFDLGDNSFGTLNLNSI